MAATPISGEKMVRLRMPVMLRFPSPRPGIEREGQKTRHAEQHHERIVVDVAGLPAADPLADEGRDGRKAVGTAAIDDGLVADLPEEVAQRLGAVDEDGLVNLV